MLALTLMALAFFAVCRSRFSPGRWVAFLGGTEGFVWLGVGLVFLAGWWTRDRWLDRRRAFALTVLALTTTVALGAAELVARRVYPPPLFHDWLPAIPHVRQEYTSIRLRGCSPTMRFTTNEYGLRADPAPADWEGAFTILTIGGSTTQCLYVDDSKAWPYRVQSILREQDLPAWVGNAGFNGHSTRGHMLVMEHMAPRLRPDLLVFMVGVNDLALSLSDTLRGQGNGYDDAQYSLPVSPLGFSRLFQAMYRWKQVHWDKVNVVDGSFHQEFDPPPVDRAGLSPLPEDLREVLPQLPEFRRNVERIIAMGKQQGVHMLFLTQPLLYGDGPLWEEKQGSSWLSDQRLKVSAATFWRLQQVYNAELKRVCDRQGVVCLDLAARVPHQPEYFYDLCHFTEAGCELVAAEVARTIREQPWLPTR